MNKSVFNQFLDMFAKLATAIFLFSSLYMFIFNGFNGGVSVKYIWAVLGLSLIISLARIPFFYELEISRKSFILWNVVYALFANAAVLGVGYLLNWFSFKHPATIIGMEITFVIVFIVVWILVYLSIKNSAEKMNEQLKKIQKED